jgi:phosphohistidine phosphatase
MANKPAYFYIQSAVIPYRWVPGDRDERLEVLIITSLKKKRWIIPKGIKEPGLPPAASAAQEALEEAGIEGQVSKEPIGSYQYQKWGGTCRVLVYCLKVEIVHETWAEDHRQRQWVDLETAIERTREEKLKSLLRSLPDFLSTGSI